METEKDIILDIDAELLRHKNAMKDIFEKYLDLEHKKSGVFHKSILEDKHTGDIMEVHSRTRILPTITFDLKQAYNRYSGVRLKKDGKPRAREEKITIDSTRMILRNDLKQNQNV